jgi:hypothetical protein
VHSCVSGVQNIDLLFLIHVWDRYGFDKKHNEIRYAELVFLHSLGSRCHVLHSRASVA